MLYFYDRPSSKASGKDGGRKIEAFISYIANTKQWYKTQLLELSLDSLVVKMAWWLTVVLNRDL